MTWLWTDGEKRERRVVNCGPIPQVNNFYLQDGDSPIGDVTAGSFVISMKHGKNAKASQIFDFSFQDGRVGMEIRWTEENLFDMVTCSCKAPC